MSDDDVYQVESILDRRLNPKGNGYQVSRHFFCLIYFSLGVLI